jgi:hypothetical protein
MITKGNRQTKANQCKCRAIVEMRGSERDRAREKGNGFEGNYKIDMPFIVWPSD